MLLTILSERKKSDFRCQFVFRGYQLMVLFWGIIAIVVLTEIKCSISSGRQRQSRLHQLNPSSIPSSSSHPVRTWLLIPLQLRLILELCYTLNYWTSYLRWFAGGLFAPGVTSCAANQLVCWWMNGVESRGWSLRRAKTIESWTVALRQKLDLENENLNRTEKKPSKKEK